MGNTRLPFLKAIPVFNQVIGIAVPMVLSKLGFGEGIDLGVLIMFSYILSSFVNLAAVFALERKICREVRGRDCLWAMLCGIVGASQQILSVINYGLVSPTPGSISSTVAMVVPVAVVFLDTISSVLSKKQKKEVSILSRSIVRNGVAVLIWVFAAIVSHLNIFQGPVILRLHGGQTKPIDAPLIQDSSWSTIAGAIALCFAGSAPIATWCTNALKENMINTKLSYTFLVSSLSYLSGFILAGLYAMYSDWKNDSSEFGLFPTFKVVECMMIVISTGLTTVSTWLVQQKGPSYAAPFAYIYLVIEVVAIPLALDGRLHVSSVIGAVILVCGIFVYNFCYDHEKEENTPMTAIGDQGILESKTDAIMVTIIL